MIVIKIVGLVLIDDLFINVQEKDCFLPFVALLIILRINIYLWC